MSFKKFFFMTIFCLMAIFIFSGVALAVDSSQVTRESLLQQLIRMLMINGKAAVVETQCSPDMDLVCTPGGVNYFNECEAIKAGKTIVHPGACTDPVSGTCGPINGQTLTAEAFKASKYNQLCSSGSWGPSAVNTWTCGGYNGGTTANCSVQIITPSIAVLSPDGGESWKIGDTVRIKWSSANIDSVYISLTDYGHIGIGSGGSMTIVNSMPASAGYYDWKIPSEGGLPRNDDGSRTSFNKYKIMISEVHTSTDSSGTTSFTYGVVDYSSNYFSILSGENGVCGSPNGKTVSVLSIADICAKGLASNVSGSGPWTWTCTGSNGGSPANCSANKGLTNVITYPAGGETLIQGSTYKILWTGWDTYADGSPLSNYSVYLVGGNLVNGRYLGELRYPQNFFNFTVPTDLVGSGYRVQFSGWGASGGDSGLFAIAPLTIEVNGVCGSANGTTVSSAPIANLCSAGTASTVSGSGPWTWTCSGQNGGTINSCSAQKIYNVSTFTACGDQVSYAGKNYNTVQIGNQCWFKENLDVGTMLNSPATMPANNGLIEKWCNGASGLGHAVSGDCSIYGGLYAWDEAMGYSTNSGAQGICPTGWHIPANDEWTTLERAVCTSGTCKTDFPYGNAVLINLGTDEGSKLSTFTNNGNGTNSSGFSALFPGYRHYNGLFYWRSVGTDFWTSSQDNSTTAFSHGLYYQKSTINRVADSKNIGYSVRCLKNSDVNNIAMNGVCGSTNGTSAFNIPTNNLCATGIASVVYGSGPWIWTCSGQNGGITANCSAQRNSPVNGVCGKANGQETSTMPPSNLLCNTGTVSITSGSGPWIWTCSGSNGGTTANCSANLRSGKIDGACGSANKIYNSSATGYGSDVFCYAGTSISSTVSFPEVGNSVRWSCSGINGGKTVSCVAMRNTSVSVGCGSQAACCGASANVSTSTAPTSNLCANGAIYDGSMQSWTNQWSWGCDDYINNVGYSCFAPNAINIVNGVCGSANGTTVSSAPIANLCSAGTGSVVSGSGPWTWKCNGVNGGLSSSCSANKKTVTSNNNLRIGSLTLDKPLNQMSRDELIKVLIALLQLLQK
jgi:uncharacterized protein (TIGR02145 family)